MSCSFSADGPPSKGTLAAADYYARQSEEEGQRVAAEWTQNQSLLVRFASIADAFFKKFIDLIFGKK